MFCFIHYLKVTSDFKEGSQDKKRLKFQSHADQFKGKMMFNMKKRKPRQGHDCSFYRHREAAQKEEKMFCALQGRNSSRGWKSLETDPGSVTGRSGQGLELFYDDGAALFLRHRLLGVGCLLGQVFQQRGYSRVSASAWMLYLMTTKILGLENSKREWIWESYFAQFRTHFTFSNYNFKSKRL